MKLEVRSSLAKHKKYLHPLIFIHGAAGGAWYFEHYLKFFADHGFDCYALSLRGHGLSEGKEGIDHFSMNDYVEDVRKVVHSLTVKPILIGHSMGGAVTQSYINKHSNEVHQAILLASARAGGIDKDLHCPINCSKIE